MIIETHRDADLAEIAALVNSAYRGEGSRAGWTTEADLLGGQRIDEPGLRADLAARPEATILTMRLREGGEILGSVWLEAGPEIFYLGMLAVAPTLQAGGLGRALVGGRAPRSGRRRKGGAAHGDRAAGDADRLV